MQGHPQIGLHMEAAEGQRGAMIGGSYPVGIVGQKNGGNAKCIAE